MSTLVKVCMHGGKPPAERSNGGGIVHSAGNGNDSLPSLSMLQQATTRAYKVRRAPWVQLSKATRPKRASTHLGGRQLWRPHNGRRRLARGPWRRVRELRQPILLAGRQARLLGGRRPRGGALAAAGRRWPSQLVRKGAGSRGLHGALAASGYGCGAQRRRACKRAARQGRTADPME